MAHDRCCSGARALVLPARESRELSGGKDTTMIDSHELSADESARAERLMTADRIARMPSQTATYALSNVPAPRSSPAAQPARHDGALAFEDLAYALDAVDCTSGVAGDLTSQTPVTVDAVIDGRTRHLSVRHVSAYLDGAGEAHVVLTAS
jgi:hypothetical protein